MLTDDKTIHDILSAVEHSRIPPLETVKAICTRLLEAEARLKLVGDLTETAAHKNSEALARALKAEARVKVLEELLTPFRCECAGRCESHEWMPADNSTCARRNASTALEASLSHLPHNQEL